MTWFLVIIFLFALLITPLVLGAGIHGRIFDYSLGLAENSIIMINTVPEQKVVSVDGSYSFNVPQGEYTVTAVLKDELGIVRYFVTENISIVDDGDYVRDLVLFPSEEMDELGLEEDLAQDLEQEAEDAQMPLMSRILISLGLLLALGFIIWLAIRDKDNKRDLTGMLELEKQGDDELNRLLAFIKKHKRVTQKQVRKTFPMSEAKISLMITDLESQGKVRKIKKGRGNVIIYVRE